MIIGIHFTIDIDPAAWEGRKTGIPVPGNYGANDQMRITSEVRQHAEEVVRSLYTDMGWAVAR